MISTDDGWVSRFVSWRTTGGGDLCNSRSMKKEATQVRSLFSQGWKAESYFGDDLTAHHMNTRSVYRFKENSDIAITHSAKYVDDGTVDVFAVSYRKEINPRHSVTETVEVFDKFLDAFYCGVQCVNNLNMELV